MKMTFGAVLAAGAFIASGQALAAENWTTRLPGVTEGLPSGALPPEGVYFVNETFYTPTHLYNAKGDSTAVRVDVLVDVPILEWVTPYKVLGADYAVGVVQPIDHVTTTAGASVAAGANLGSGGGRYDTLVIPGILSWSLPHDFHVATQLGVWVPDGSRDDRLAVENSNRYWAVEPGLGLSWLHDGWAANLLLTYDINFEKNADGSVTHAGNPGGTYRSGDQFIAEYSFSKTIGKWTVGFGGYALKQVEGDEATKADGTPFGIRNGAASKYAIGPLAGYNFGPVIVQAYYNENISTKNYVGGSEFWTRILVPF